MPQTLGVAFSARRTLLSIDQIALALISLALRAENVTPRVCGMFYRATVQAVLLYDSETWVISPASVWMLEGFHVHCTCRMTILMPRKRQDRTWKYPSQQRC